MKDKEDMQCYSNKSPGGKVLDACLLSLLKNKGEDYGYGLLDEMCNIGFCQGDINMGTLYRSLRGLEKEKFVTSKWVESEQGPRKRVYKIEEEGIKELDKLMVFLRNRKEIIDIILDYNESFAN
ncbi:MAG: PadR family transcriptional regulator [Epulopiscium sp.]|nr:PadR family transcriptional regulator [Candidatus Epulonipiscium sp.]